MIVKELDEFTPTGDRWANAGRKAEEQMAYYLRRAFSEDESVRVLNGVRLERQGDIAQIDHLIVYRFGLIIVESKSVTTTVRINDHGEWTRWYNGREVGMPSPIQQAKRQGEFLQTFLEDHREDVFRRVLFIQFGFKNMPVDHLIAISDAGVVKRSTNGIGDEVVKADQVVDRARAIIEKRRRAAHRANSILNPNPLADAFEFGPRSIDNTVNVLLAHHEPPRNGAQAVPTNDALSASTKQGTNSPPSRTEALRTYHCRACKSDQLAVTHGRYGYYFKCKQCQGNTPIKLRCSKCGAEGAVRKNGIHFMTDCRNCGRSTLFFTNAAPEASEGN